MKTTIENIISKAYTELASVVVTRILNRLAKERIVYPKHGSQLILVHQDATGSNRSDAKLAIDFVMENSIQSFMQVCILHTGNRNPLEEVKKTHVSVPYLHKCGMAKLTDYESMAQWLYERTNDSYTYPRPYYKDAPSISSGDVIRFEDSTIAICESNGWTIVS